MPPKRGYRYGDFSDDDYVESRSVIRRKIASVSKTTAMFVPSAGPPSRAGSEASSSSSRSTRSSSSRSTASSRTVLTDSPSSRRGQNLKRTSSSRKPKALPKQKTNFFTLPLELREKVYEYVVIPKDSRNYLMPMNKHEGQVLRQQTLQHQLDKGSGNTWRWRNHNPTLFDCGLLTANRQIQKEALNTLLRINKITVVNDLETKDTAIQQLLKRLLSQVRDLDVEIPVIDSQAWYMTSLASNTDLKKISIQIKDDREFLIHWRGNEEKAKEELRAFKAIHATQTMTMKYDPDTLFMPPMGIAEDELDELEAEENADQDLCDEIDEFIQDEVVAKDD